MQPLPEKVAAIEAMEPPKDINELRWFCGPSWFLQRSLSLSLLDVTACLNTMLRKGAVFKWTEQYDNACRVTQVRISKNA